jgi:hypothetical protein
MRLAHGIATIVANPVTRRIERPGAWPVHAPSASGRAAHGRLPHDASVTSLFAILVVVFLAMHGVGHVIWFLAAWTPVRAGVGDGRWGLPGSVTIRSPLGRLWGAAALLAVVLFVLAALALLAGVLAWRGLAFLGILASFVAVGPWRSQSPGSTWLMAILADLVLLILLSLPVSLELTGAT